MNAIEKVENYLKNVPVFYLSTTDGNQPKCRPLGLQALIGDKIYFAVGTFKDVYAQMQANPLVEICASTSDGFLRYYGKAVFEEDYTIATELLEQAPYLKSIYNDDTGYKLGVFHLEEATAEFRSMLKVEESYQF